MRIHLRLLELGNRLAGFAQLKKQATEFETVSQVVRIFVHHSPCFQDSKFLPLLFERGATIRSIRRGLIDQRNLVIKLAQFRVSDGFLQGRIGLTFDRGDLVQIFERGIVIFLLRVQIGDGAEQSTVIRFLLQFGLVFANQFGGHVVGFHLAILLLKGSGLIFVLKNIAVQTPCPTRQPGSRFDSWSAAPRGSWKTLPPRDRAEMFSQARP